MEELLLKQYGKLKDINQRLKYVSDIYYIGNNGYIYMRSLVPFIEKIAIINDNVILDAYYNSLILPNKTYQFTSKAKKSKMMASLNNEKIVLEDNSNDEILLNIDLIKIDLKNVNDHFEFYKNYDILTNSLKGEYTPITEDQFTDLASANVVYIQHDDLHFTITKNIFMCIKKKDSTSYKVLDIVDPDNDKKKYVIFRKDTDIMSIYTLAAFICF